MEGKTVNCPVHGILTFSPLATAIIDTLEFQRLRFISQLSVADFVYPGATHTRFEHSLGTAHLSKLFISEIAKRQPELHVTEREIRCVELAGLCHDLGHGPFSHLWEDYYRAAADQLAGVHSPEWRHEATSMHMLRRLIERNRIFERFPNDLDEEDLRLIENLIQGRVPAGEKRRFLYQIVSNPDSGLDVDKWDYFMRDALNLGIRIDFEYQQLLRNCEVLEAAGQLQICFRDKCADLIWQGFENRFKLHKKAYQHTKVKIFQEMFLQALLKLEPTDALPLWSATRNIACDSPTASALDAFAQLTDIEVKATLRKKSPLYEAMLSRSTNPLMYRYAGKSGDDGAGKAGRNERKQRFLDLLPPIGLRDEDIALIDYDIHMGKSEINPMEKILVFPKGTRRPAPSNYTGKPLNAGGFIVALRFSDAEKLRSLEKVTEDFCRSESTSQNSVRVAALGQ